MRMPVKGGPIELRTERLLLRPLRESDFDAVHAYASDPEVTRYMDWGPNSVDETQVFLQMAIAHSRMVEPNPWEFAVVLESADELLGVTGISLIQNGGTEFGYCFNRTAWGLGYATEAAHAVVDFAFDHLKTNRVQARCDPENLRSSRVLEKLGMQREGWLRQCSYIRGAWRDRLIYALLRDEWQPAEREGGC